MWAGSAHALPFVRRPEGDLVATQQERQRDQQATGGHERDHVGHARHQDPPDLPHPRLGRPGLGRARGRGALDARRARVVGVAQSVGDHPVGVVDPPLHSGAHHRQPGEAMAVPHPHVTGEDHGVGGLDHGRGERLGAGRALGLDLDVDTGSGSGSLEGLRRHVGVRDARGTGGDPDQAPAYAATSGGSTSGRRGGRCTACACRSGRLGGDGLVHQGDDVRRRRGAAQAVGELRPDQRPRQHGQHLEVGGVAALGSGDQEGQVGGAVLGPELDRGREPGEDQRRHVDGRRAAVGDRDAAGQPGRRGRLPGQRVRGELVDGGGAACLTGDAGQRSDDRVLIGAEIDVEPDQVGGEHVGHRGTSGGGVPLCHGQRRHLNLLRVHLGRFWNRGAREPGGGAAVGHGQR